MMMLAKFEDQILCFGVDEVFTIYNATTLNIVLIKGFHK